MQGCKLNSMGLEAFICRKQVYNGAAFITCVNVQERQTSDSSRRPKAESEGAHFPDVRSAQSNPWDYMWE